MGFVLCQCMVSCKKRTNKASTMFCVEEPGAPGHVGLICGYHRIAKLLKITVRTDMRFMAVLTLCRLSDIRSGPIKHWIIMGNMLKEERISFKVIWVSYIEEF